MLRVRIKPGGVLSCWAIWSCDRQLHQWRYQMVRPGRPPLWLCGSFRLRPPRAEPFSAQQEVGASGKRARGLHSPVAKEIPHLPWCVGGGGAAGTHAAGGCDETIPVAVVGAGFAGARARATGTHEKRYANMASKPSMRPRSLKMRAASWYAASYPSLPPYLNVTHAAVRHGTPRPVGYTSSRSFCGRGLCASARRVLGHACCAAPPPRSRAAAAD